VPGSLADDPCIGVVLSFLAIGPRRRLLYHRLGLAPFSLSPRKAAVPASSPSVWVGGREVEYVTPLGLRAHTGLPEFSAMPDLVSGRRLLRRWWRSSLSSLFSVMATANGRSASSIRPARCA
jgi:hypothetical protein